LINDLTARSKSFRAPRARDRHDDGDVANLQITDPVDGRDGVNWVLVDGLLHDCTQRSLNTGMSRVAKVCYCPPLIFVAHDPGKQRDTTRRRHIAHGPVHISDGKRSLADTEHSDHIHVPESNQDCHVATGSYVRVTWYLTAPAVPVVTRR
jgi:hypothetical protein